MSNETTEITITREMLKAGEWAYEATIRSGVECDDYVAVRVQAMAAAYRAMRRLECADDK